MKTSWCQPPSVSAWSLLLSCSSCLDLIGHWHLRTLNQFLPPNRPGIQQGTYIWSLYYLSGTSRPDKQSFVWCSWSDWSDLWPIFSYSINGDRKCIGHLDVKRMKQPHWFQSYSCLSAFCYSNLAWRCGLHTLHNQVVPESVASISLHFYDDFFTLWLG